MCRLWYPKFKFWIQDFWPTAADIYADSFYLYAPFLLPTRTNIDFCTNHAATFAGLLGHQPFHPSLPVGLVDIQAYLWDIAGFACTHMFLCRRDEVFIPPWLLTFEPKTFVAAAFITTFHGCLRTKGLLVQARHDPHALAARCLHVIYTFLVARPKPVRMPNLLRSPGIKAYHLLPILSGTDTLHLHSSKMLRGPVRAWTIPDGSAAAWHLGGQVCQT